MKLDKYFHCKYGNFNTTVCILLVYTGITFPCKKKKAFKVMTDRTAFIRRHLAEVFRAFPQQ